MSAYDENDRAAMYRNDPRSTEDLLMLARANDTEKDDELYWRPIAILQHRIPEIMGRVQQWIISGDDGLRDIAATVLGQGWVATKASPEICADILLEMLARDPSTAVLASIIHALGHLHDPRSVEPLVRLRSHSDVHVRFAVVSSLCGCDEESAIAALIENSKDEDYDVRNWATFGLGSMIETDTQGIRDSLCARLVEEEDELRGEALVGLARRGELRVIPALLNELERHDPEISRNWLLIIEAAEAVVAQAKASGAKEWQPLLAKFAALRIGNLEEIRAALQCTASQK